MNLERPAPGQRARLEQPALAERLELLRLRAAGERLTLLLARQEMRHGLSKLRTGAGWAALLARVVLPHRGGAQPQGGPAWMALATGLLPLGVALLRRLVSGRRGGGGAGRGLGLASALLGLGAILLRYLRTSSRGQPHQ
jgi:hypothetical protein